MTEAVCIVVSLKEKKKTIRIVCLMAVFLLDDNYVIRSIKCAISNKRSAAGFIQSSIWKYWCNCVVKVVMDCDLKKHICNYILFKVLTLTVRFVFTFQG